MPGQAYDPRALRKTVLDMAYAGSTVHIGCAFSLIELLAVLYRDYLRYPDNDPGSPERDYLVLSKGHGVMAQYACMHEKGWLSREDLARYFADGTDLKGLADSRLAGVEATTGSLGHGFSVAVGLALGAGLRGTDQRVFAVVGDGELNEGPIWEGALFAAHHQLRNLVMIVDENGFQAMGRTQDILRLDDIQGRLASFGFEAACVDGHSQEAISQALATLLASASDAPKALIARTIKGKGVSFMEGDNRWHYTRLDAQTYRQAIAEVEVSAPR
jgi:transketolase